MHDHAAHHPADAGTVSAAIHGDRDALRTLWLTHRRWAAAILMAHMPRDADLDDLLQTVAARVVEQISTLREPEAFRPWLRLIAVNEAMALGRRATRRKKLLPQAHAAALQTHLERQHHANLHSPAPATPDPLPRDEGARLLSLCTSLPEPYREPLLLRALRGMTYRQIAEVMNLPETTIETRIARARRMLRELANQPAITPSTTTPSATPAEATP
jgi:RNA polymerase sigma-70 factor (ECF subfamily)